MIRLFVRFLFLAAVCCLVWLGRDILLRQFILADIKRYSGASAEIGSLKTSWQDGSLVIEKIDVADPQSPKRELLQIAKTTAHVHRKELSRRAVRIPTLDIEGIQITVDAVEGQDFVPNQIWTRFKDQIPKELGATGELDLGMILGGVGGTVEKMVGQFETPTLIDEQKRRWKTEVERLKSGDILNMLASIESLKTQAQTDYQALVEASKRDKAKLQSIQLPKLDADSLSATLIGNEMRNQWEKLFVWSDWVRSLAVPAETNKSNRELNDKPKRRHGKVIPFAALPVEPNLLIETTNLNGLILFGTLPVYFNGTVRNISNPMPQAPAPLVAQFYFSGSGIPASPMMPEQLSPILDPNTVPDIGVVVQMDHLGEQVEDRIAVRCPAYSLSEQVLGNPESLAILVSPGISGLDGVLVMKGESLAGEIRVIQTGIRLRPILPEKHRNTELERTLQQSFQNINHISATIFVGGTRSAPVYAVKSNLGDLLLPQLETLIQTAWNTLKTESEQKMNAEANEGVMFLNTVVREILNPAPAQGQGSETPVDQLIQRGIDKLPGLLDKLKKK